MKKYQLDKIENFLENVFTIIEKHFYIYIILLFVVSLILNILLSSQYTILRQDDFLYLLKAIEITKGNISPMLTHQIGWPFFISPFIFFTSQNLIHKMLITRILSRLIVSSFIFPLAYIGKIIFKRRQTTILLFLFTFSNGTILFPSPGTTEPLFTLLFLITLLFVLKSMQNQKNILFASLFAALSYYVRFNGPVVMIIVLLSFFILRKHMQNFKAKYIVYSILIFVLVSFPMLYQRYLYFGNPFYYGGNSRYFVDGHINFCSNIPSVSHSSLTNYILSHAPVQIFEKFFIKGTLRILFDYSYHVIPPLLLFPFLWGLVLKSKSKKFIPLYMVFVAWIVSLSLIWSVLGTPRHLCPTLPFVFIFASAGIYDIFSRNKYKNTMLTLFLITFVFLSLINPIKLYIHNEQRQHDMDGLVWGKWASHNLKGIVAVTEGMDVIMFYLPDVQTTSDDTFTYFTAPESGITTYKFIPSCFNNFTDSIEWMKEKNISYLVIDEEALKRFKITDDPRILLVYSNFNTSSAWKVKIFKINLNQSTSLTEHAPGIYKSENNLNTTSIKT